ncbi:hypothetical protein QC761_0052710 [Podospora bellae-mahoneyi]|uniref:Uncharacterized protein n=1 Tax=Podospora bellae-mahoneyi TaxID=2093777 RepID=A0ABR0FN33_9PEZI|nr:hypothetical protein QC761_0052710 [Podospora bellae-mahoneyi]
MTHHATARSPRPSIQATADKAISYLTKSIIRANDITLAGIPKKRRDICCLDGKRTRGDHGSENLTHFRESLISWLVFPDRNVSIWLLALVVLSRSERLFPAPRILRYNTIRIRCQARAAQGHPLLQKETKKEGQSAFHCHYRSAQCIQ